MKKIFSLFSVLVVFAAFSVASCKSEKQTKDKRVLVEQLIKDGKYKKAKQQIIILRSNYPNDKKLIEMEKIVDEKNALEAYTKYWKEAETKNNFKEWIRVMIKIKKVENLNKDMVNDWLQRATVKSIETGAKQLNDGELLGLLKKLVIRYQTLSVKDRLSWITKFHNEGRFPMKEWKDTFITKFPELLDENDKFVGYPKPEEDKKEAKK